MVPSSLKTAHGGTKVEEGERLFQVKPWQNEGTRCQKHLLRTHVSPIFPGKHCFQKHKKFLLHCRSIFCFRKQCFSCAKTGKHCGNICPQQMLLATQHVSHMFPRFARPLLFHGRNIFAYGNSVSRVAKLGNIEERCVRNKCFWQHVF